MGFHADTHKQQLDVHAKHLSPYFDLELTEDKHITGIDYLGKCGAELFTIECKSDTHCLSDNLVIELVQNVPVKHFRELKIDTSKSTTHCPGERQHTELMGLLAQMYEIPAKRGIGLRENKIGLLSYCIGTYYFLILLSKLRAYLQNHIRQTTFVVPYATYFENGSISNISALIPYYLIEKTMLIKKGIE